MQRYEVKECLGDGNFGTVFRAINRKNHGVVAIKRLKRDYTSWNDCVTCRELQALQVLCRHPHIVELYEVIRESENTVFFVFEFMESGNLLDYMREWRKHHSIAGVVPKVPDNKIKSIASQILLGLSHMHEKGYVHRDIKPENILLYGDTCKIGDFGLAREAFSAGLYTEYVSTRWYRAPEVLLRAPYGAPVDLFAVGCIFAEMHSFRPLFPGETEIDQICRIAAVLGVPTAQTWPEGIKAAAKMKLSFREVHQVVQPRPLEEIVPCVSTSGMVLLHDLLNYSPALRPTAFSALQYEYFASGKGGFDPMLESATVTPTSDGQCPHPVSLSPGGKDKLPHVRRGHQHRSASGQMTADVLATGAG